MSLRASQTLVFTDHLKRSVKQAQGNSLLFTLTDQNLPETCAHFSAPNIPGTPDCIAEPVRGISGVTGSTDQGSSREDLHPGSGGSGPSPINPSPSILGPGCDPGQLLHV